MWLCGLKRLSKDGEIEMVETVPGRDCPALLLHWTSEVHHVGKETFCGEDHVCCVAPMVRFEDFFCVKVLGSRGSKL